MIGNEVLYRPKGDKRARVFVVVGIFGDCAEIRDVRAGGSTRKVRLSNLTPLDPRSAR